MPCHNYQIIFQESQQLVVKLQQELQRKEEQMAEKNEELKTVRAQLRYARKQLVAARRSTDKTPEVTDSTRGPSLHHQQLPDTSTAPCGDTQIWEEVVETELRIPSFDRPEVFGKDIIVACRMRPLPYGNASCEDEAISLLKDDNGQWKCDWLFTEHHTNNEIMVALDPLPRRLLHECSFLVICFGGTSSGKTHTMGPPHNATSGIAYRLIDTIFASVRKLEKITMKARFVEVLEEGYKDLLDRKGKIGICKHLSACSETDDWDIGTAKDKNAINSVHIACAEEFGKAFERAARARQSACTDMNVASSRTHFWTTVYVKSHRRSTATTLHLVDLAGVENVKQSNVMCDLLTQSKQINKSLYGLNLVLNKIFASEDPNSVRGACRGNTVSTLAFYRNSGATTVVPIHLLCRRTHTSQTIVMIADSPPLQTTNLMRPFLTGPFAKGTGKIVLLAHVWPEHTGSMKDTLRLATAVCVLAHALDPSSLRPAPSISCSQPKLP